MSSNMSTDLEQVIRSDLNINKIITDKDSEIDIDEIPFILEKYYNECEDITEIINSNKVATYYSY